MFDGVPIPDGEGEVVSTGLWVSDEESSMLVLLQKKLLLGLYPLDLPKIPPATRDQFKNLKYNGSIITIQEEELILGVTQFQLWKRPADLREAPNVTNAQ